MHQLVPLYVKQINREDKQTVNARELHAFLESRQDFSNWITNTLKDYGFQEGVEYVVIYNKFIVNNETRGRNRKDYFVTFDVAKELAMVTKSEKGRQARKYFIECEKQLKEGKNFVSTIDISKELQAVTLVKEYHTMFKSLDLFDNTECALSANRAALHKTGIDVFSNAGYKTLPCPESVTSHEYTPTQLGKRCKPELTPEEVNIILRDKGLQYKEAGEWNLTELGKEHAAMKAGIPWHTKGSNWLQIKWYTSVMKFLMVNQEVVASKDGE